jgi:putative flippase GtrA
MLYSPFDSLMASVRRAQDTATTPKIEMNQTAESKHSRAHKLMLPKFLVVGALGALTNLLIFFVVVDLRDWNPTVGATLAFVVAVGQNYLLHHSWTFAHRVAGTPVSFRGYLRFMLVALTALGVNLAVLWTILYLFNPPLKVIAQAGGIAAGTTINYIGSRLWVFAANE